MNGREMTVRFRNDLELPLRASPIRFAVGMKNGLTSHSWGVDVRDGDVYIFCRENAKDVKVSLHASGQQHIAFTTESGHQMEAGSRFWNVWREPPQQRPPVPSFKLLFPSWGTTVSSEVVGTPRSKWNDNQIIIEGDEELITSVWFFIVDMGYSLHQQGLPSMELGILSVGRGRELHVVACREYPRNLRSNAEKIIASVNTKAPLTGDMLGDVLTLFIAGDDPAGCPYLLPVLVDVGATITSEDKGRMAYHMCMKVLVERGYFSEPELFEKLDRVVQDAWKVIGADWLRSIPAESRFGKLIARGNIVVENERTRG